MRRFASLGQRIWQNLPPLSPALFRHRPRGRTPHRWLSRIAIALSACLIATQAAAVPSSPTTVGSSSTHPAPGFSDNSSLNHAAHLPSASSLLAVAPTVSTPVDPLLAVQLPNEAFRGAQAYYNRGQYEQAVAWLNQAIAGYRQSGDSLPLAIALSNLSLVQQKLNDWPAATDAIDESLALLRQTQTDLPTQAAVLDIQGNLQLATGQTEAALSTWQQTESLHQQSQDVQGQVQSRINQAQALRILGFYGRAREQLSSLAAQLPELSEDDDASPEAQIVRARQLQLLGDAQRLSGTVTEAKATLQQSLELTNATGDQATQASVYLSLANAHRAQSLTLEALQAYQQATDYAPTQDLRLQSQISQLSLLAQTEDLSQLTQNENYLNLQLDPQQLLDKLLPQVRVLPTDQSGLYSRIHLAQTLLDKGSERLEFSRPNLEQLLQETVEIATALNDRRSLSYAEGTLGYFYEQGKAWPRAIALTQNALQNAQSVQAADIGYRWNWQLGRLLQKENRLNDAIRAYDDAIADLDRLRSDLVSINRDIQFSFKESVEPVYRESVGLLIQAESQKNDLGENPKKAQSKQQPSPKKSDSSVSKDPNQKSNLEQARERIEALQLAELDNFFREACLDGKSVLLDKVVDQDNPTTAIVYPIILEDRLEVIVKIPQEKELKFNTIDAPRETIEKTLKDLAQDLRRLSRKRRVRKQANTVYQWLIEPFREQINASDVDTLIFVLDGPLRSIPMSVLFDGEKYLVEDYAVGVSLGLQLLEPKSLAKEELNVLAAGLISPPKDPLDFGDLPNIENEFRLIRETGVRHQQILNDEFTSDRLAKEVQQEGFNVVHLATHGKFSSDAEGTFILAADGRIKVTELDELLRDRSETSDAAIEMLILSACETAAGDDRAALGLAGIAVKAGARSTLASLWQIDDFSTSVLMGEFYNQIATTDLTKAQALREAQLSLLRDPDYDSPSYWAPYILVGNWL